MWLALLLLNWRAAKASTAHEILVKSSCCWTFSLRCIQTSKKSIWEFIAYHICFQNNSWVFETFQIYHHKHIEIHYMPYTVILTHELQIIIWLSIFPCKFRHSAWTWCYKSKKNLCFACRSPLKQHDSFLWKVHWQRSREGKCVGELPAEVATIISPSMSPPSLNQGWPVTRFDQ